LNENRPAPPYRDQAATRAWGIVPERERKGRSDYRRQREADAPLEQWLEAEVERELDRITAEVNAWWRSRDYDQNSPEAYLAAVEERKAKARTHNRLAVGRRDGTTLSDEAWDAELSIERGDLA
jgi:hypothetical protein